MPENLWGYAKRLRFVEDAVSTAFPDRPFADLHILDVGCGNGSELALPIGKLGFNVTGIDTHAPSIAHAQLLSQNAPNVRFACAEVDELHDSYYDVVILSEVLEHLAEPRKLLAASSDRLRDNGLLIVTVPNGYGEFEIDSFIFKRLRLQRIVDLFARNQLQPMAATDNRDSGHVQFFTVTQLQRLFDDCSLSVFRKGSASFLAGPLIGHTLARSQRFIDWNSRVTNKLPHAFASGWYFALRKVPR